MSKLMYKHYIYTSNYKKYIKCKYTAQISAPLNCFHESNNKLATNPNKCTNCNICINECPMNTIIPDIKLNKYRNLKN